jgi:anti-sigma-K factor RskA
MSGDREHSAWTEDLAPYCLGALEPAQNAEFERHLAGCDRCRSQVRRFESAVNALPQSVERLEPSPELRTRLMAQVRGEVAERAPRGLPLTLRPLVGLAAVLLIAGAFAGYLIGTGGSSEQRVGETIVSGQAPGVVAEVVREGEGGTLRLANVRQLPDERVLQAWIQRRGGVSPVRAVFVPGRDGRAATEIENLRGVERVMVTTEPPGGSESPTSAPIVALAIPG